MRAQSCPKHIMRRPLIMWKQTDLGLKEKPTVFICNITVTSKEINCQYRGDLDGNLRLYCFS